MSSFEFLCFSFIQMAYKYLSQFSSKGIMTASWADFTSLKHFIILNYTIFTFFWKRSCLDVACQYYRVPLEWVAINACLSCLFGFDASPVTGELSDPFNIYCTFSTLANYYFEWRKRFSLSHWSTQLQYRCHQWETLNIKWSPHQCWLFPQWKG